MIPVILTNELYGRVIEVVTGVQGEQGFRVKTRPIPQQSGLRVDFNVNFKSDGKPASARVLLYNPPTRMISDLLRGERSFLSLEAGYLQRFGIIFAGIPTRDGVEVERASHGEVRLEITAHSGGARYRDAATSISLGGRQVAAALAEDIARRAGYVVDKNEIPDASIYPRGFSFSGKTSEALAEIAAFTRTEVFIDGDRLSFLSLSQPRASQLSVPLFSARQRNPNLVGTPTWTDKGLKFQGLLEPDLRPGKQVVVEFYDLTKDAWVKNRLVLREVQYTGSNYGQEFFVTGVGKVVGS